MGLGKNIKAAKEQGNSKFLSEIKTAISTENSKTINTDNSKTVGADNSKTISTDNSTVDTDIQIKELDVSESTESSKTVDTDSSKAVEKAKIVTLTVKIEEPIRDHWMLEARKRKTNVSQLIKEYLTQELGLPEECER